MTFWKQPKFTIVEIERPRQMDKPPDDVLITLQHHPGFTYLTERLRTQRFALEAALKRGKHATLRDVDILQAGIYWAGWLETQIQSALKLTQALEIPKPAFQEEQDAFNEIHNALQLVGT